MTDTADIEEEESLDMGGIYMQEGFMNQFPSRGRVEHIREMYPLGTRIQLDFMGDDPRPIPRGTMGTVVGVDDVGSVMMKWDNGRSLSLIPGEDSFHKVDAEPTEEETIYETEDMDMTM